MSAELNLIDQARNVVNEGLKLISDNPLPTLLITSLALTTILGVTGVFTAGLGAYILSSTFLVVVAIMIAKVTIAAGVILAVTTIRSLL